MPQQIAKTHQKRLHYNLVGLRLECRLAATTSSSVQNKLRTGDRKRSLTPGGCVDVYTFMARIRVEETD